jgi:hypothetical protein
LTLTELATVLRAYRDRPVEFNEQILRRRPYWSKQKEICKSFLEHRITCVTSGNAVGKSYVASGLNLFSLFCFPGSMVRSTAPSNQLLVDVLWGETRQAYNKSILSELLGNSIKANPQRLELADGWDAVGWASDSTAKMSGRHRGDLVWILDEASDIKPEVWDGVWSTNPSKVLVLGNPLTPSGDFYRLCTETSSQVNVIQVSSLESPDIALPRSKRGMADSNWLQGIREQYGEDSPYWKVHVLGQFTDEDSHALIPIAWLDRCSLPLAEGNHGLLTLSVDLSGGTGRGDASVICVRHMDGIVYMNWSNNWPYPEGVVQKVVEVASKYQIPGHQIVYDAGGLGLGFGWVLNQHGLGGAYGYVGGETGGKWATNFRGASALAFRDRLDPSRNATPFSIPKEYLDALRPQITELRYELATRDQIKLEPKDRMKLRLKRSPDQLDSLLSSFCRNVRTCS